MSRSRGFTLLEVMLAVAISAIGIVSLLELFGGSMRLARISTEQTRAVVLASSLMDQALWRAELPERDFSGEEGDYRWTISIKAVDPQLASTEDEWVEALHRIVNARRAGAFPARQCISTVEDTFTVSAQAPGMISVLRRLATDGRAPPR